MAQSNVELFSAGLPITVTIPASDYPKWNQYKLIEEVTSANLQFYKKFNAFWNRWNEKGVEKGCLFLVQRAKKPKRTRLNVEIINPKKIGKDWIEIVLSDGVFWVKRFVATAFLVTEENISTLKSLIFNTTNVVIKVGCIVVVDNGEDLGVCLDIFSNESDFYSKYSLIE